MRRSRLAAVSALALIAAACVAQPVLAQNLEPVGLPPRGAVQPTDVIVDQPAGSPTVQGAQASAIATYVLANVGSFAFQNYASLPSASGSPPISAATVFPCVASGALDGCTAGQLLTYMFNGPLGADPTGAADSTSALQTWLNAGSPGTIPCGTYKTTATLTMETAANNGQQVRGSGAGSSVGAGACRTVIQPTSAVTTGLIIDGTPIGGWVMGIGLHDLAFDMANMTDASTTSAIKQVQAFDIAYERVRVINDGVNKRGWLLKGGAFTTHLDTVQGNIVDLEGTSASFGVTTLTITNPDIGRLIANYAVGIRIEGGAIQTATAEAVYLRNVGGIYMHTDIESLGGSSYAAYDMNNTVNGVFLQNTMEGWGGALFNGLPSSLGFVDLDLTTAIYTPGCPFAFTTGYANFDNCGTGANGNRSSWLSGSSSQPQYLYQGRTAGESIWGVSGATNDFFGGIAPGDTLMGSSGSGEATWLIAGDQPIIKLTTTSVLLWPNISFEVQTSPQKFLSGSATTPEYIFIGLTSPTSLVGVAANANDLMTGTAPGDMVVGSSASGQRTWLMAAGNPVIKYDSTGHQFSQGYPGPSAGAGTSSVQGNDNVFVLGTNNSVTSSAITFGSAWSSTPRCVVTGGTAAAFPYISAVSTTALTIGWSASVNAVYAYAHCEG